MRWNLKSPVKLPDSHFVFPSAWKGYRRQNLRAPTHMQYNMLFPEPPVFSFLLPEWVRAW